MYKYRKRQYMAYGQCAPFLFYVKSWHAGSLYILRKEKQSTMEPYSDCQPCVCTVSLPREWLCPKYYRQSSVFVCWGEEREETDFFESSGIVGTVASQEEWLCPPFVANDGLSRLLEILMHHYTDSKPSLENISIGAVKDTVTSVGETTGNPEIMKPFIF